MKINQAALKIIKDVLTIYLITSSIDVDDE